MSEHRFDRRPAVGGPTPFAPAGTPTAFLTVPAAAPAVAAEVYRLAYEAAIARVVARRRCFAPFSVN